MARAGRIGFGSILLAATLCADAAPPSYTAIRIDTLGGTLNYGFAINAEGHVVGRTRKPGETARSDGHAYLFDGSTTLPLGPVSWEGSAATDINDRGDIVGTFSSATGSGGFVVSNGVVSELRSVAGTPIFPTRISASGAIAGWHLGGGSTRSFLLVDGVLTDLGAFGGPYIAAAM